MAMVVMQGNVIGIRVVLTSMFLKPFLYVVLIGKNLRGLVLIIQGFFHFTKNRHQHSTLRDAIYYGRKQKYLPKPRIRRFTYLREAGEFFWLMGICID